MEKNYEVTLPENYREVFTVDAQSKKLGVWLNVAAFAIMVAILIPALLLIRPKIADYSISSSLLLVGAMAVYIVLHELTHGAAYKLMTGRKLTFGMGLTVAYCGVPDIFVYRRTALIALLAPFVVFLFVFGLPMFLLNNSMDQFGCAVLLAVHIGGCAGDLWDTWLYLTKFKNPGTLMQDTGPKQTFYLPEE